MVADAKALGFAPLGSATNYSERRNRVLVGKKSGTRPSHPNLSGQIGTATSSVQSDNR